MSSPDFLSSSSLPASSTPLSSSSLSASIPLPSSSAPSSTASSTVADLLSQLQRENLSLNHSLTSRDFEVQTLKRELNAKNSAIEKLTHAFNQLESRVVGASESDSESGLGVDSPGFGSLLASARLAESQAIEKLKAASKREAELLEVLQEREKRIERLKAHRGSDDRVDSSDGLKRVAELESKCRWLELELAKERSEQRAISEEMYQKLDSVQLLQRANDQLKSELKSLKSSESERERAFQQLANMNLNLNRALQQMINGGEISEKITVEPVSMDSSGGSGVHAALLQLSADLSEATEKNRTLAQEVKQLQTRLTEVESDGLKAQGLVAARQRDLILRLNQQVESLLAANAALRMQQNSDTGAQKVAAAALSAADQQLSGELKSIAADGAELSRQVREVQTAVADELARFTTAAKAQIIEIQHFHQAALKNGPSTVQAKKLAKQSGKLDTALGTARGSVSTSLQRLSKSLDSYLSQVTQSNLESLRVEVERLESSLVEQSASSQSRCDQLIQQLDRERLAARELKSRIEELTRMNAALEKENKEISEQAKSIAEGAQRAVDAEVTEELVRLHQQIAQLQSENQRIKENQSGAAEDRFVAAESSRSPVKSHGLSVLDLRARLQVSDQRLQAAEAEITALKGKLKESGAALRECEQQWERRLRESENLRSDLEQEQIKQFSAIESKVQEIQAQHNAAALQMKKEINEERKRLELIVQGERETTEKWRFECEKLQLELDSAARDRAELEEEMRRKLEVAKLKIKEEKNKVEGAEREFELQSAELRERLRLSEMQSGQQREMAIREQQEWQDKLAQAEKMIQENNEKYSEAIEKLKFAESLKNAVEAKLGLVEREKDEIWRAGQQRIAEAEAAKKQAEEAADEERQAHFNEFLTLKEEFERFQQTQLAVQRLFEEQIRRLKAQFAERAEKRDFHPDSLNLIAEISEKEARIQLLIRELEVVKASANAQENSKRGRTGANANGGAASQTNNPALLSNLSEERNLSVLAAQLSHLQLLLSHSQRECEIEHDAVLHLQSIVREREQALEQLDSKHSECQKALSRERKLNRELETRKGELAQRVSQLVDQERQASEAAESAEAAVGQLKKLKDELARKTKLIQQLQDNEESLRAQNAALNTECNQAKSKLEKLSKSLAVKEAVVNETRKKLDESLANQSMHSEESTAERARQLQAVVARKDATIKELRSRIESLNTELESKRESSDAGEKQRATLKRFKSDIERKEAQIQFLKTKLENAETEIGQLKLVNQEMTKEKENETSKTSGKSKNQKHSAAQPETADGRGKMRSLRSALRQMLEEQLHRIEQIEGKLPKDRQDINQSQLQMSEDYSFAALSTVLSNEFSQREIQELIDAATQPNKKNDASGQVDDQLRRVDSLMEAEALDAGAIAHAALSIVERRVEMEVKLAQARSSAAQAPSVSASEVAQLQSSLTRYEDLVARIKSQLLLQHSEFLSQQSNYEKKIQSLEKEIKQCICKSVLKRENRTNNATAASS